MALGPFFLRGKQHVPATNITLQCPDCRERNYTTTKNKKNDPDRLELKKFCWRCRKYTLHKETR